MSPFHIESTVSFRVVPNLRSSFVLGHNHCTESHYVGKSNEALIYGIPGLNGIKVLQIVAGAEHSALVTGNFFVLN